MDGTPSPFYRAMIANIEKIMKDRDLKQSVIADYADISRSQISKVLHLQVPLSFQQFSNLAHGLRMREIDILTYPHVLRSPDDGESDPVEAILQIRLAKDKKDQVMRLIFGDNNLEIINK